MSLTIEFAGVTTLVWDKARNEATAFLLDLGAEGFHQHYATLATEGGSHVTCPDPDTAVTMPGAPIELGVWNLKGTDIEIDADATPLDIDDEKIDETQKPPERSGSIRWLPELGELCQSRILARHLRYAARVRLPVGRVSTTAAGQPLLRVVFEDNDQPICQERYLLPRFMVEIDCAKATVRLGKDRELKFASDHHVIISNTCVCEQTTADPGSGHFYAHYLLVDTKRKPRIRRVNGPFRHVKGFSVPEDPEHCCPSYIWF
jgi:hypothetical protein